MTSPHPPGGHTTLKITLRLRYAAPLVLIAVLAIAVGVALVPGVGVAESSICTTSSPGLLCAGAASVDTSWHVGAGQGQYGSDGNGFTSNKFDPFHHQTKMVPSDGMQSRLFTKALVLKGPDGTKVAVVKTELYLQQDVLTRRVAELIEGDPSAPQYEVEGLDGEHILLAATHNHSTPEYASTAVGVWLFTDTFDFRMFETTARRIADAIRMADERLTPARIGASVSRFSPVQQNILGPGTADDGSPAGFPRDHFDDELTAIRVESTTGEPIAAWVNLGMHPESLETNDLVSADFVGMVERTVERGLGRAAGEFAGPVVVWTQGSVGDVEPDRDERANPPTADHEYWHRNFAQAERMARLLSAAVLDTWRDVADETPGVPGKIVELREDHPVDMLDHRFSGPIAHPLPTYANCRTARPAAPGAPDCQRLGTPPDQYGTTLDTLKGAGIPVPDNAVRPSAYGGVQESFRIRLQAIRIGDILVGTCPCEPISDMVLNYKSRADAEVDDLYHGFEWPCRGEANFRECNFRTASWRPDNWRPVPEASYQRMLAQIRNDASGWEDHLESLQSESEPQDPEAIFGNFTYEDIQGRCSSCAGYVIPIMVGQANDYVGYVVTYREFMRGDHYRKALTAFGPHTADYINTRLVRMGANLQGGPSIADATLDPVLGPVDEILQTAKILGAGKGGTGALDAFESAIPDDGGTAGKVIKQPAADLQRFGGAGIKWEGGSNWTDNPEVVVEHQQAHGTWYVVATQEGGEVVVTLKYESPISSAPLDWLLGGKRYEWTALFEVFEETEPGNYRFVVNGNHRKGQKPNPYRVESEVFRVFVWEGIVAHDLAVDVESESAGFLVDGVELTTPESQLETDEDAILAPDEVHYPDTYSAPTPYIRHAIDNRPPHRYCYRCAFRPWADTGRITSATVTVMQSDGITTDYSATFDGARWVASGLDLANGDFVIVERALVRDQFGNLNGAPSNAVGPLTGLTERVARTVLDYTGDTKGAVGKNVNVSAVLTTTAAGSPLEGMKITFKRGSKTTTGTTDGTGEASGTLRVDGPPGDSKPLEVTFDGTHEYQPVSIIVPFEATTPNGGRSMMTAGALGSAFAAALVLGHLLVRLVCSPRSTPEVS